MIPNVDGREFDSPFGPWRVTYIAEPRETTPERHLWTCQLRIKWIDPNNPDNKATPEYRLHLDYLREDFIANDAEDKFLNRLAHYIANPPDTFGATFSYDDIYFKRRATDGL